MNHRFRTVMYFVRLAVFLGATLSVQLITDSFAASMCALAGCFFAFLVGCVNGFRDAWEKCHQ